jgi:hypothetical protein
MKAHKNRKQQSKITSPVNPPPFSILEVSINPQKMEASEPVVVIQVRN